MVRASTPSRRNWRREIQNISQRNPKSFTEKSKTNHQERRVGVVVNSVEERLTETAEKRLQRPKLQTSQAHRAAKWRRDRNRNCISPILATVFLWYHQMYFFHFLKPNYFSSKKCVFFLNSILFSQFPYPSLLVVWLQPSWLQNENRNSRYDVTTSCLILLYGQHGQALKVTLKRQKRRGNMIFVGRSFKAVLTNRGIRISDVLTLPVFFRAIMTKIHLSCLKSPNIWKSKALLSFPFFYSFSIHSFFVAQVLAHLPS